LQSSGEHITGSIAVLFALDDVFRCCLLGGSELWHSQFSQSNPEKNSYFDPFSETPLYKSQKFDPSPDRIETPNLIEITFGIVDYVGEATPGAKFDQIRSWFHGGLLGKWVKYTPKIFIYIYFFQKLTYRSDPWVDFSAQWLKRRGLTQGCAFWGLKNSKLIFDPEKSPQSRNFGPKLDLKNFRQNAPV